MVPTRNAPTDSLVDLLADLVAFPTESRTSNLELIDLYADRAAAAGAVVTVVHGEAGRANLHLRFGPDAPGGVLLSGHTDVVPAGSGWATDPYELTEVDGQLRARGSADMKGFLAAALVLMEATELDALRAPVHLGLSYDEEVGCVGVHGLLDALAEDGSCAPDVVVVGEPTSMRLCNAHAGKVGHHLEVVAAAGHSSRAGIQPSAIHEAAALALRIHGLNDPSHGISANVGTLHGGVAVNVLAPTCTMEFEVRHTADTDPDAVLADVLAEVAAVNARLVAVGGHATSLAYIRYPALDTDPALAPVVALGKLVGRGAPGPVGFGTEAGLYADRLGVPAVILGPGDIADAHRPDEFVDPAQLDRCSDVLRRIVDRFCTESEEA
tara:strand:+ start:1087 stop:2232 length:1146 start_codon:yes stop_codon:yes gene_type:complete